MHWILRFRIEEDDIPERWKGTIYSMHPGYSVEVTSMANLEQRTGKTLDQWLKIVNEDGPTGDGARRDWLKTVHGFTINYAMWVVERAAGRGVMDDYDPASLVEEMYTSPKAALRPLYDRLLEIGVSIGDDVKACPCATIVPLYRKHAFAQIKPTTRMRIDLGLSLKGMDTPSRLMDTGGAAKGDRITHRIPIVGLDDIDGEVETWLQTAYERDA